MKYNIIVSDSNSQVKGTTIYGDSTYITIASGVTATAITNEESTTTPDGVMFIGGTLTIKMQAEIATAYFGYGKDGVSGSYSTPVINNTGIVNITGNSTYSKYNYINFQNVTTNNGVINLINITLNSNDKDSVINGTGTLNLVNTYLVGNNDDYTKTAVGSISGGQVVNMTNSSLAVSKSLKGVTINMIGEGNYLALNAGTIVSGLVVTGFGAGNIIDLGNGAGQDTYSYNEETGYLIISSNGTSLTLNIGLGYDPTKFAVVDTTYGNGMTGITYTDPAPTYVAGTKYKPSTTSQDLVIDATNRWVDGTTAYGQTTNITVSSGSTTGAILNEDYPNTASGSMFIDGTLNIDMNYAVSAVSFGSGTVGTTSNYTLPTVNQTGIVNVTGSGAYNTSNFIGFKNTTVNNGVINLTNITMMSGDKESYIAGTGTINLINVRLNGNDENYEYPSIGSISGGQVINMTNSDLAVSKGVRNVTINMISGNNYLGIQADNYIVNLKINGFGKGDIIDVGNGAGVDTWSYNESTGDLIVSSNGASFTINIGLGYDITKFSSVKIAYTDEGDNYGVTYDGAVDVCMLPGTMIRTPEGDIAIENLRVGDFINVYNNQMVSAQKIIWIGKGNSQYIRHYNYINDQSNYPIRILKDAISPNVPYKDLCVTLEHCLFFDNKFIPARMLVNGRSIIYDQSYKSYDYYHIETEKHSIIMADGMLTESYLNTDSHQSFYAQNQSNLLTDKTIKSWENHAAVPLCVDRNFVEPIYKAIEQTAIDKNIPDTRQTMSLTYEHNLCLTTSSGVKIEATRTIDNQLIFFIPPNTSSIFLTSRSARMADVMGNFIDDRRHLGVLIGDIFLCNNDGVQSIETHLMDHKLTGWNTVENDISCRWTQGKAELPLHNITDQNKAYVLKISILSAGPYFVKN
ncbi:hypothetical protein HK18_07520 [Commensalibacter intestini]|uniref:Hedgehog/Intein (Hint) domain-containing protein n=2 Tax=Commensalibacter intestini TaxID=479936 RepID=A0A251ZVQ7_9PROT|nr:Hint domain-containing protein [Commensalibacter intestini]OUI78723.1 hypothetical protein HK18_07520 [Commensalibacter intestini]